jgi:hypothetical protein
MAELKDIILTIWNTIIDIFFFPLGMRKFWTKKFKIHSRARSRSRKHSDTQHAASTGAGPEARRRHVSRPPVLREKESKGLPPEKRRLFLSACSRLRQLPRPAVPKLISFDQIIAQRLYLPHFLASPFIPGLV